MSVPAFGFSEFTTWPWSYARDLERYGAHGASLIEVCLFKQAQKEFGALADIEKHGLRASSIQMKVHSVFVDSMANKPEDPADRIAEMKETIASCAPFLPRGTPFIAITGIPPQKNIRKAVERTVEALKELGEAAGRAGMRIAFEPLSPVNIHTDTAVWGLDQGLDVIERVADPNVGVCIDSWNVWQTPQLEDVIGRCRDRIFVVQLSDWQTPRSTADRYTLGTGAIDFRSMIRAIRATGYDGPWVVEILSSMHLDGSLWKRDLDQVLEENRAAFERIWAQSAP